MEEKYELKFFRKGKTSKSPYVFHTENEAIAYGIYILTQKQDVFKEALGEILDPQFEVEYYVDDVLMETQIVVITTNEQFADILVSFETVTIRGQQIHFYNN
jgi:hypothetical protein